MITDFAAFPGDGTGSPGSAPSYADGVLTIDTEAGPGTVELARPAAARGLLLLTHGAGGGVGSVDLLTVRDALVAAGIAVGLVTQPYRVAGRRTPPVPAKQDPPWTQLVAGARAHAAAQGDAAAQADAAGLPLLLGGRSNGARVACRTATACGALAVVALAFPLHPPGRPDKSRLAELDAAGVPTLVVQGERDPFGMPPAGVTRQVLVVAGDHSLKREPQVVADAVNTFVTSILDGA